MLLEPIWGNADELVAVYDQIFTLEDAVRDLLARPQGLIELPHGWLENEDAFWSAEVGHSNLGGRRWS